MGKDLHELWGATMTFDERLEEIIEIFWVGYENDFTEIHKRFVAGEITIEQQVEESEVVWDRQTKQAITAIKQAMRETMPERRKTTHQLRVRPHIQEQIDVDGYVIEIDGTFDQAIDEIEKGFGL